MQQIQLTGPSRQAMSLLVYGPPGAGKSTVLAQLAAAAEADGRSVVLMDAEHGLVPAAISAGLRSAQLLDASQRGAAGEVFQRCQQALREGHGLVGLDTVTEISRSILDDLASDSGALKIQAYGEQATRLGRVVRSLRDLTGTGTVAVASAQQDAQDIEGLPGKWHPAVRAKLVTDLVSQFDCVARLRQVATHEAEALALPAGTRYLDFRPTAQQVAKCRTAAELFAGRSSDWHVWPCRNQADMTALYGALSRTKAADGENND